MAECFASEINKNINNSSKQSSDVPSCQDNTEEVMEPLLLEDFHRSKIPIGLSNVLKVYEELGTRPSKTDFLVRCIYVLMLEYGFIPQNKGLIFSDSGFSYTRIKQLSQDSIENSAQDSKQCNGGSYSLTFVLPPDQIHLCKISCIKMSDDLIINATIRNIEDVNYTIMLDILSYFTDGMNQSANLKSVQNMRALSTLFKEHIAFPVKHTVLSKLQQQHPCMKDLPVELIHHIFKYIHGTDVVRLTTTCKRFYTIRQDLKLWEYLLMRDFGIAMDTDNYKALFQTYGLTCTGTGCLIDVSRRENIGRKKYYFL